jgi:hypothetical protein
MKKIWEYKLSTNTIWLSFDYGQVTANSEEEAIEKATIELKYHLQKVNDVLQSADVTKGFSIEMDFSQLEVTEQKIVEVNKVEIDLFEDYENHPPELVAVLEKFDLEELDYSGCADLVSELEKIGYTCFYELDAQPFGLKKF